MRLGLGQCYLAALLAVLAHDGNGRFEPDTDFALGPNKSAFGGYAPNNIFGSHRFG